MTKKSNRKNSSNPYLHPKWQKKRLEIMERDNFTCQWCGEKNETLNVHHKIYLPDHEIWDYNNVYLITLCEECHSKFSQLKKSILEQIQKFISDICCF
jgi:5-methylcytosine-specific restriction endonuclease McrA